MISKWCNALLINKVRFVIWSNLFFYEWTVTAKKEINESLLLQCCYNEHHTKVENIMLCQI